MLSGELRPGTDVMPDLEECRNSPEPMLEQISATSGRHLAGGGLGIAGAIA